MGKRGLSIGKKMKILVVDDDPTILNLVRLILEASAQYDVVAVPSAKAALEEIEEAEDDFDCILADIQMPELDGIQLVRLIRQTPGYQDVPITMLTAMQERQYLTQAFSAGATDYITKPFDFHDLRSRIPKARKIAIEKTMQRVQPLMAGEMRGMGTHPKDFRLKDPFTIDKIEGAIDYGEFENFVRQLTRRRLSDCSVFVVKIGAVDQVYRDCSSEEFKTLVRDVARSVQDAVFRTGGIVSYRGNGIFLCIPEARLGASRQELERALNDHLATINELARDIAVKLWMGEQRRLKGSSFVSTLETLSAAVESAEMQSFDPRSLPESPNRFLATFGLSEEERHFEKRAYEEVLNEALDKTTDEAWLKRLEKRKSASTRKKAVLTNRH